MDNQLNNQANQMSSRAKAFFKWILVAGLVIVINLFAFYAIDVFYKEPRFENFCKSEQVRPLIKTEKECVAKGGQWTETPPEKSVVIYQNQGIPVAVPAPGESIGGYCNEFFTCQKDYDEARKVYMRNVFLILVALGAALIIGSYYAASYGAVSLGFALAGIVSLVIGTARHWSDMDDRLRVIVLGAALVALVWYGVRKFRE